MPQVSVLFRRGAVVLLAGLLLATGCRGNSAGQRAYTDGAGREVLLRGVPERILSTAPSNTEILFALGLGSRVVGVTTSCDYPPEARAVEKVGEYWTPSLERIVGLRPDLVLAEVHQEETVAGLEQLGIPVFVVNPTTVDMVLDQIALVGRVTGIDARAHELVKDMRRRLEDVRARVAGAASDRPTVFWVLDESLWTVGPGSFVHDLITLAGGDNIASSMGLAYAQYSMEILLREDPDVIILALPGPSAGPALAELPGWKSLRAVREGRVYRVDPDLTSRPGPRVVEGVEAVARLLYPETSGK